MALLKTSNSKIQGIVSVLPKTIEDNLELDLLGKTDREKLVEHTGIRFRRRAEKNAKIQDYFSVAIQNLAKQLDWELSSIDILICVTQSPEVAMPSVSCRLHGELNLSPNVLCFDINSGCSGFVYGLYTVQSLIAGFGQNQVRAVLCCGDLSSQLTGPGDKTVRPIFSDGVAAIGIEKVDEPQISYFNLQTYGEGQKAIQMEKTDTGDFMRLNGLDVFHYSVKHVPKNIIELMDFATVGTDEIDGLILHQANQLINESIRKKVMIDSDKSPSTLYQYGNTASASIPLTLCENLAQFGDKEENKILISGFGVGFSIASAVISYNPKVCFPPIEI